MSDVTVEKLQAEIVSLKLIVNELLNGVFAPRLHLTSDLSNDQLAQLTYDSGWLMARDRFIGSDEEWNMWLDRFRRFASLVRT